MPESFKPSTTLIYRLALVTCGLAIPLRAADPPGPAASYLRLLDSGRVPAERLGPIVEMIGKRGNADELALLLGRTLKADGFSSAARLQALEALRDAAATRGIKPAGDLSGLGQLIGLDAQDRAVQFAALELAGRWRVDSLAGLLRQIAIDGTLALPLREAAMRALGQIGGPAAVEAFDQLSSVTQPQAIRYLGAAGLAQVDLEAGARRAAEVLASGAESDDPAALLGALVNQKGGAERLAAAIEQTKIAPEPARTAVRYLYSIGRGDGPLISALSSAAGISADVKPPTREELDQLVAEVQAKGDPARGELVFRRRTLSCLKCHALSGAGGNVGPDLSAVGATSPVDYVLTSILQPDLSVKEAFQQAVVQTADGKVYQGIIVQENPDLLVLRDAEGRVIKIPRDEEDVIRKGGSLMPKGLVNLMTHADFLDLARFISELGKPGEYTIRSAPTVQRWRYLAKMPAGLAGDRPDVATFKAQLLDADPADWSPAYAKVAGVLPLEELTALSGEKVLYLQALVDVTAAGPVGIRLDSVAGVRLWVDGEPHESSENTVTDMSRGEHKLTLRVDTSERTARQLRVELFRPDDSPAEFTVQGGP